jgi:O-antigen ligase
VKYVAASLDLNKYRSVGVKYWLTVIFLTFIFLTGGSSRSDVQSLAILQPVSVIALGISIYMLPKEKIIEFKIYFFALLSLVILLIFQFSPIFSYLIEGIKIRELIGVIYSSAEITGLHGMVTVSPLLSAGSIFGLAAPLAIFFLGMQMNSVERGMLLPAIIALGLTSALLSILQAAGDPHGAFYTYRVTNNGTAVGFFANRNHQAVFLASLLPALAVFASSGGNDKDHRKIRPAMCLLLGCVIVPLILVSGSRAGLFAGLLGLGAAALLYKPATTDGARRRISGKVNITYIVAAFGILTLVGATVMMSRAEGLQRLVGEDSSEDARLQIWAPTFALANDMVPIGSGIGSFSNVYQTIEPDSQLTHYFINQAHNDWLDIYLTLGVVGVGLMLFSIGYVFKQVFQKFILRSSASSAKPLERLAVVILGIFCITSAFDYPLRTAIVGSYIAIALVWLMPTSNKVLKRASAS